MLTWNKPNGFIISQQIMYLFRTCSHGNVSTWEQRRNGAKRRPGGANCILNYAVVITRVNAQSYA